MPTETKPETLPMGNVIDAGDIAVVEPSNVKPTLYGCCLLVQFASKDDLKAALQQRTINLTVFGA